MTPDQQRPQPPKGRPNASYPYGYRPTGFRRVAVNEAEQKAITRIIELRSTNLSYRRIAAALDAEGHTPRHAGQWSAMTVRKIALRTTTPRPEPSNQPPS